MTLARNPEIQLSTAIASFSQNDPGSWNRLFQQAQLLDRAGIDRLVVSDHVVFGERLEEYGRPEIGGREGGKQPTGPDGHWLEPLTTLSVLAGMTSRIRLGTGILIAALRRPVVLAKSASTLDVLSGGRLDLGVGVGWQREEYEAAGLDFEVRGRLLDHTIEVCQALWRQTAARYESKELSFDAIHMMPKPLQPNGVPLWISGTINPRVVRRLARFGTGWIPWGADADDLPNAIIRMRQALADVGRDTTDLQVVGKLNAHRQANGTLDIERTMAQVPRLRECGVTDLRLALKIPADESEALDHLLSVVTSFRTAAGREHG
jgi:probable F420-dependent oxidoreductase